MIQLNWCRVWSFVIRFEVIEADDEFPEDFSHLRRLFMIQTTSRNWLAVIGDEIPTHVYFQAIASVFAWIAGAVVSPAYFWHRHIWSTSREQLAADTLRDHRADARPADDDCSRLRSGRGRTGTARLGTSRPSDAPCSGEALSRRRSLCNPRRCSMRRILRASFSPSPQPPSAP